MKQNLNLVSKWSFRESIEILINSFSHLRYDLKIEILPINTFRWFTDISLKAIVDIPVQRQHSFIKIRTRIRVIDSFSRILPLPGICLIGMFLQIINKLFTEAQNSHSLRGWVLANNTKYAVLSDNDLQN